MGKKDTTLATIVIGIIAYFLLGGPLNPVACCIVPIFMLPLAAFGVWYYDKMEAEEKKKKRKPPMPREQMV
jgi:Ca2+/Na+ antiporter